jgi:hypothetical protein
MTSETGGNVPNPFLNLMGLWQNWVEVSRNFYENAIKTNEQWLKALWDPWAAGYPSQRETIKVE